MRLTSIQLVNVDETGVKKIYLPRAGPRLINCNNYGINHWGAIKTVRIFRENKQVSGIGISFVRPDVPIIKIGFGTSDKKDFAIGEDKVLRGFYGAANDEYITELGLIIEDIACMEEELLRLEEEERARAIAEIEANRDKQAESDVE